MNNVWTIALKTPCTGLLSSPTLRSTFAQIAAIGNTRGFASSQWNTTHPSHTIESAQRCGTNLISNWVRYRSQALTCDQSGERSQINTTVSRYSKRSFSTTSPQSASKQQKPKPKTKQKAKAESSMRSKPTGSPRIPSKPESETSIGGASRPSAQAVPSASPEAAQVQLSASQVESILGPGLTFDEGMQVLQELQNRRVTGSLAEEGISFPNDAVITPGHAERGLNWLRENYPVDEETAAAEWAEEEAAKLEAQYTQRAEELWLYKKNDDEPEVQQIQQHDEGGLYGQSVLEQRQKEVKARKEAEAEEAEKALEAGEAPPPPYKGYNLIVKEKAELGTASIFLSSSKS
jgi:hypothetical protein